MPCGNPPSARNCMRGVRGTYHALAWHSSRLLSQFSSSNSRDLRDVGGTSNSRNLARSSRCVHRLHGMFPSKVHPGRLAAREDFRETAFFRRGSWDETDSRRLRALYGSISTGKGGAYSATGLRTLEKRDSSSHCRRWTSARLVRGAKKAGLPFEGFFPRMVASRTGAQDDDGRAIFDISERIVRGFRFGNHRGFRFRSSCYCFSIGVHGGSPRGGEDRLMLCPWRS